MHLYIADKSKKHEDLIEVFSKKNEMYLEYPLNIYWYCYKNKRNFNKKIDNFKYNAIIHKCVSMLHTNMVTKIQDFLEHILLRRYMYKKIRDFLEHILLRRYMYKKIRDFLEHILLRRYMYNKNPRFSRIYSLL